MAIRRTSHAVYDTRHHLVWALKYRKWIMRGDIQKFAEKIFYQIGEADNCHSLMTMPNIANF